MNEAKPDINKVLFMHLVSMLAMSAIQQMGKLVDPNTGKAEINLEAAQATIDMLDMLEARTRGNLDAEETRLLKDTLMSLKMNYVESLERKTDDPDLSESRERTTDDGPAKAGRQTPDDGRRTADDRPAKAGSGEEKQTTEDGRQTTDDGRRTTDDGRQTPDDGRQTPDDGRQTTDDGRRTTDTGPAKARNGNEDKTPKYHKKYE